VAPLRSVVELSTPIPRRGRCTFAVPRVFLFVVGRATKERETEVLREDVARVFKVHRIPSSSILSRKNADPADVLSHEREQREQRASCITSAASARPYVTSLVRYLTRTRTTLEGVPRNRLIAGISLHPPESVGGGGKQGRGKKRLRTVVGEETLGEKCKWKRALARTIHTRVTCSS